MVQGTSSGAGKSLLAAALCRIFRQDGHSVAPFKSQNMALNSFITDEGLEMGRAQVVQAQAAGIAPSVRMNPILLKPSSDTGSQVIVNGEVLGDMSAAEYFKRKRELQQTYDENSKLLLSAVEAARAGTCKLLILDEIMGALSTETVDADLLRSLVERKPEELELVLTGRNPPDWLVEAADYVSEIRKQKHPFDRGIPAREGIEL